jgi:hypothetical protein
LAPRKRTQGARTRFFIIYYFFLLLLQ